MLSLGCIMLVGVPFAVIVLLVTVIGIPLALLLVFGYVVLMLLGCLVAAIFVGDSVLERIGAFTMRSWQGFRLKSEPVSR